VYFEYVDVGCVLQLKQCFVIHCDYCRAIEVTAPMVKAFGVAVDESSAEVLDLVYDASPLRQRRVV
jgi:hypothetical protein